MGNTQTNEAKPSKGGKSPGKVKSLMKIRGKRANKQEETTFDGIVEESLKKGADLEDVKTITPSDTEEDLRKGSKLFVTDSWQKANQLSQLDGPSRLAVQEITPSSADSSSDSVFTDPLTPVGFSTELNQCYYSDETVNIDVVVPDNVQHNLLDLPLNNFKLNEFKVRKELDVSKKLSKLGVSKPSQISLDRDSRDWFVSPNVECVKMEYGDFYNFTPESGIHLEDGKLAGSGDMEGSGSSQQTTSPLSDNITAYGPLGYQRYNSVPATSPDSKQEHFVLKKVASLTLDKVTLDTKITKPKFVPEKLDFKLYEKFEGHMLVNWFISEFSEDHQVRQLMHNQDLKLLAVQFATHLLAAGVLHQIKDKDVPMHSIFKPDLMYYWAHSEIPASVPQTPGRLNSISWPPTSPSCGSDGFTPSPLGNEEAPIYQTKLTPSATEQIIELTNTSRDAEIFAMEEEITRLKQEVDKYKTLNEIRTLTENTFKDFSSPLEETKDFFCKNCDNLRKNAQCPESPMIATAQETILNEFSACEEAPTASPKIDTIDGLDIIKQPAGVIPPPPPPLPEESTEKIAAPPPPPLPSFNAPPPPPLPDFSGPTLSECIAPPPPPFPGCAVPPPPPFPSSGGFSGPPPPPLPGSVGPPPPPFPGSNGPPPPPFPGVGPPPPPPPGSGPSAPPPPGGPVPFPAPPACGWNPHKAMNATVPYNPALRKKPVVPLAPMRPLYWQRVLVPVSEAQESPSLVPVWSQLEELESVNLTEFTDLFSRPVVTRKPTKKKIETKSRIQAVKLLDSKRSQNVGILSQSLHVEFTEIENAIYSFDTSVVSLEALQQIYEVRATSEELELIRGHLTTTPEIPLDKPEQFLYDLAEISNFAERISCFMFQIEFDDSIGGIGNTLANIKATCDFLVDKSSLQTILSIILTLGNYMNGGNMQRGQADGFSLEILSKLKDVKSNNSQLTLLHFIVRTYMGQTDGYLELIALPLPIPEPEDIRRASSVNFDEVAVDLQKLQKNINSCEERVVKVLEASTPETLEPFKEKMNGFLENAKKLLQTEMENLEECRNKFMDTMKFYQFKPRSGTVESCSPSDFFELWLQFCKDFKDIWKKELIRIEKEKREELKRNAIKRKSERVVIKKRPDGLKARIEKLTQYSK